MWDDGRLVEDGTYEALMAGGLYAAMFASQAAWYHAPVNSAATAMDVDLGRQRQVQS